MGHESPIDETRMENSSLAQTSCFFFRICLVTWQHFTGEHRRQHPFPGSNSVLICLVHGPKSQVHPGYATILGPKRWAQTV